MCNISSSTVLIKKDTLRLLEKAKKLLKAKSYDEVIRVALNKIFETPNDMFGIDKNKITNEIDTSTLLRSYTAQSIFCFFICFYIPEIHN